MNNATLLSIMALGMEGLKPAKYPDGRTPKGRYSRAPKHTPRPSFKPVNLLGISPAEYRRSHLGKKG